MAPELELLKVFDLPSLSHQGEAGSRCDSTHVLAHNHIDVATATPARAPTVEGKLERVGDREKDRTSNVENKTRSKGGKVCYASVIKKYI